MKKKLINNTHIEGYVYSHKLEARVTGDNSKHPGTSYIRGDLDVATDEDLTNIIKIRYTYVTPLTAKNKTNLTYEALKQIIDGTAKTVMSSGKENAAKVRIDSAIGLNEFYNDEETLVSVIVNDGGFIHFVDKIDPEEKKRDTFECDMVITNTRRIDANEERGLPEKVAVKGAVFSFRNELLPVEFSVTSKGGMDYFESLEASPKNVVFTKVWGRQISAVTTKAIEQESAFGETLVKEVPRSRKDWVLWGANPETYEWGLDETMTNDELKKAMADRETHLAALKQNYIDRQNKIATKTFATTPAKTTSAPVDAGFNF